MTGVTFECAKRSEVVGATVSVAVDLITTYSLAAAGMCTDKHGPT